MIPHVILPNVTLDGSNFAVISLKNKNKLDNNFLIRIHVPAFANISLDERISEMTTLLKRISTKKHKYGIKNFFGHTKCSRTPRISWKINDARLNNATRRNGKFPEHAINFETFK